MANKINYGLEQVHIAFVTNETTPAWDTPVALPGAVKFSPKPEGNEVKFYADNTLYYTSTSNLGYSADLEVALIPDEILATMLGWRIDANGMLIEVADAAPKPFALMGQIEGDSKDRRFVYYYCIAARPSSENSTSKDTVEPQTQTLTLTILPIVVGGTKIVRGVMELGATNSTAYNAFFDAVTLPAA